MTFHPALSRVAMAVELREGKPVVVVTTRDAIREPILDLLVELEWGSGRFVREYAILLDLPAYRPRPPSHTVTWPAPSAPQAAPPPAPAVAAAPPPAATPSTARTPAALPGTEYRVRPGDTLAKIANAQLHAGVTLDQMLIALYRGNIGAFVNDDMNVLLAGHVLKIPDRDTVAAVDPDEATRAVTAQMAHSAEGRRAIAEAAPVAPRAEAPRTIAKPAPTPDQVKLARSKEAEAAAAAAREDDRIARDRALADAKTRIAELEKIVADLRKLLEIRNQRLAELEKRAAEAQAASPVAPVAPVSKPAVEAPKPAPVAVAPKPTPSVEAPKPAPVAVRQSRLRPSKRPNPRRLRSRQSRRRWLRRKPAPPSAKPAPAPAPPKPAARPRPTPPPEPEPGLVERYIGDLADPVMLGGLGGVVLLLIGYGAYAWRKKKRVARAQLSESLLGVSAGGTAAIAAGVAPAAAAASAPASDEADPLEEADVYLAYGRDAQAEELLREAVEKGETRPIAYSKLLQIYAKLRDTKRFESTALKLKGLVHGEGPEWVKAMALGRSIDPDNGLYGQGEAAEVVPDAPVAEEPEVDFDLDAVMGAGEAQAAAPEAAKVPSVDFAIDTTSSGIDRTAPGMDFDLGTSTTEMPARGGTRAAAPAAAPAEDVGSIDFDLGGVTTEPPATQAPTPSLTTEEAPEHIALEFDLGEATGEKPAEETPPAAPESGDTLDAGLSFDMGGEEAPPATQTAPAAPAEKHLDTISFDLGGTESAAPSAGGGDAKWQEVTTKLQLAKSFEEIGDAEGARELLREVIAEGDAAQRAHAEKMLAGLE